eukprot:2958417-Rhodomonas_salina.1
MVLEAHSSLSVQSTPLPLYPELQAHVNLPSVAAHAALAPQLETLSSLSVLQISTSHSVRTT